jgi:hypothetical protein
MIYKYIFVIMLLVIPVSACPFDGYQGHWVRMQFIDNNGTPMIGMIIVQQQMYDDLYSLWFMRMLGYNHTEYENLKEEASYHFLWTDSEGYVEAPMFEAMKYNVTYYNTTTEEQFSYTIYPRESEYVFTEKK